MKVQCKYCLPKEGIAIPEFTNADKENLHELKKRSPVHLVKHLIDHFRLSHLDAKYIAFHINNNYGLCNRCSFDALNEEYISCPKCGALNFNWKLNAHWNEEI